MRKFNVVDNNSNNFEIGEIVTHVSGRFYTNGEFEQLLDAYEVVKLDNSEEDDDKMTKFNVGDKVNIINTGPFNGLTGKGVVTNLNDDLEYPIEVECEVCDFTQRLNFSESDLEPIDDVEFKVGDIVRLTVDETTDEHYSIIGDMLEEPERLTIRRVTENVQGTEPLIYVEENTYSYHPDWLEKVDVNGDFSKDDLESGMLIRDSGGVLRKVLIESGVGKVCIQDGRYTLLDSLEDDLTSASEEIFDIMEVYEPRLSEYFFNFDVDNHELIWSRPEEIVQKYCLEDEFIGGYLTYIISESRFYLGSKIQAPDFQTQFTDDEIEKLDIPVERFKKIPVED